MHQEAATRRQPTSGVEHGANKAPPTDLLANSAETDEQLEHER